MHRFRVELVVAQRLGSRLGKAYAGTAESAGVRCPSTAMMVCSRVRKPVVSAPYSRR